MTIAWMRFAAVVSLACALSGSACRSPNNATTSNAAATASPANAVPARASAATVKAKIDVCNLLTSDDVKAVQGEAFKEAQRSDTMNGDFVVAQCYYAMPTTANSVVVNVTTARDEAGAPTPKTLWQQTFAGNKAKERDRKDERDEQRAKQPRESDEEGEAKEASPPERVNGLGDEAFWVGSPIGGALYVLRNDHFFRISVGGAGDQKTKLSKSKTLAQDILKKL